MTNDTFERIVLEEYENKFSFKKNKSNLNITFNRIAFIFFIFLVICTIYSIRVLFLGSLNSKIDKNFNYPVKSNYRADITDNSGNYLVKSVRTTDIGINPNITKDKKKLLISLKLIFPNRDFSEIEKKLNKKKFFYLKKKSTKQNTKKFVYLVKNQSSQKKNYQEFILRKIYLVILLVK